MALNLYCRCFFSVSPLDQSKAVGLERDRVCGSFFLIPPSLLVIASGLCKETGFTFFGIFLGMEILDFIAAHTDAVRQGNAWIPSRVWRKTRLRVGLLLLTTL